MTSARESFQLDNAIPTPLYYRVKVAIQNEIRDGIFRPGDMLPSEKALCARYEVSNITVRRALRELVDSGLIYRENGVGTFVAHQVRRFAIALIFCGFAEEGWRRQSHMFGALIGSVGQVVWEHGSALTVSSFPSPSVLVDAVREIGNNRTYDGLLIRFDQELPGDVADALQASGLPFVIVKKRIDGRRVNSVWMDNRHHARVATEHLLSLGHRRIGIILGRRESRTFRERFLGYQDAIVSAGLPVEAAMVRHGPDEFAESGYAEAMSLLEESVRPTALLIGSDHLALGVYQALLEKGIEIPGEMSLVGFDEAGLSSTFQPQLTALATTDFDLGRDAAQLLLALLNGDVESPEERIQHPTIILRATSSPPRTVAD